MKLIGSSIKVEIENNTYHCIFTRDGRWSISRHGEPIGEVDTLVEVDAFVERSMKDLRNRLRRMQDEIAANNS